MKDKKAITEINNNNYLKIIETNWNPGNKIYNKELSKILIINRTRLFNAPSKYKLKFYSTVLEKWNSSSMNRIFTLFQKMEQSNFYDQLLVLANIEKTKVDIQIELIIKQLLENINTQINYIEKIENHSELQKIYKNKIIMEVEEIADCLQNLQIKFVEKILNTISDHRNTY